MTMAPSFRRVLRGLLAGTGTYVLFWGIVAVAYTLYATRTVPVQGIEGVTRSDFILLMLVHYLAKYFIILLFGLVFGFCAHMVLVQLKKYSLKAYLIAGVLGSVIANILLIVERSILKFGEVGILNYVERNFFVARDEIYQFLPLLATGVVYAAIFWWIVYGSSSNRHGHTSSFETRPGGRSSA